MQITDPIGTPVGANGERIHRVGRGKPFFGVLFFGFASIFALLMLFSSLNGTVFEGRVLGGLPVLGQRFVILCWLVGGALFVLKGAFMLLDPVIVRTDDKGIALRSYAWRMRRFGWDDLNTGKSTLDDGRRVRLCFDDHGRQKYMSVESGMGADVPAIQRDVQARLRTV